MNGIVNTVSIKGIRAVVPKNTVSNTELLKGCKDRRLKKQIKLTGIYERRVTAGRQKASDLAAIAADNLLNDLGWNREKIDVLIFVTQSADLSRPGSALIIQDRLGIGKECLAYDINMGCAGFIGGLETIVGLLNISKGRGLLLVGESNAVVGDETNHNEFLDGDASAAIALEYEEKSPGLLFEHFSEGSKANLLYKPLDENAYMDGNAIMYFALEDVANSCKEFISKNSINIDNIDFFVFHQAQKMIIDGIVNELGIPEEKVLISCDRYGNTSSASIPLTIASEMSGLEDGTKRIFACGFGIGLSWGISVFEIDVKNLKPIIESDYYYDDYKKFIRKED